jgi:hypothetical protein
MVATPWAAYPVLLPLAAVAAGAVAPELVMIRARAAMASTQPLRVAGRNGPPPAFVASILGLAAVGALVVIPLVAMGGVVAFGLSVWALMEGLAAFEPWIESDGCFQP